MSCVTSLKLMFLFLHGCARFRIMMFLFVAMNIMEVTPLLIYQRRILGSITHTLSEFSPYLLANQFFPGPFFGSSK